MPGGRNQRPFGDGAKKGTSKQTTRTVKKGGKETDPDFDHCAVCIESYKQNDVVRILPCKYVGFLCLKQNGANVICVSPFWSGYPFAFESHSYPQLSWQEEAWLHTERSGKQK